MELRSYIALVRRWLWLIVLCTLLAGGIAYLTSRQATPIYAATATVLLDTSRPTSATPNYQDLMLNERLAETYASLLTQASVIDNVTANLNQVPRTVQVSVTPQRNTSIMQITVQSEDSVAAAYIANNLAGQVNNDQRQRAGARYATNKTSLSEELESAQSEADGIRTRLASLDSEVSEDKAEYSSLTSKLTSLDQRVNSLSQQLFNITLSEDQGANLLYVLEDAQTPLVPVSPRPLRNALYGALLGLMAGVGAAFVIEYLDDTIKASQDIPALLGTSVLALIGRIEQAGNKRSLVSNHDQRSPIAEAYRMLRTNIRFSMVDDNIRTLLITSPSPGEGKSTTAANLATVMAQAGHRTILVDADLRRPVQHQIFALPNKEGLTTALVEREKPLGEYLRPTGTPELFVLTSGPMPPNPSELLGSHRMQEVLAQLQTEAEYIIIDTPPVLAVTDSSLLASSVKGVVLVFRANLTRLEGARRAIAQLSSVQARLVGTVLNGVKQEGDNYYYYYYYGNQQERKARTFGARMRALFLSVLPRR